MELYKRFRPTKLADIIGQNAAVKQLEGYISGGNIPHVLGFFGQPGIGKTTLARIMAKQLRADEQNIIEMNMAQNNGVEDIRKLQDSLRMRPLGSGPMVYILDEFHACTKQAYQALLKPLEDTPEYAYFILCTSMPEKIDSAIKTRIAGIQLVTPPINELEAYVKSIAERTKVCPDPLIYRKLASIASGSIRTLLVDLERAQACNYDKDVIDTWGEEGNCSPDMRDLCNALYGAGNWDKIYAIANAIPDDSIEGCRRMVLNWGKAILKNKPAMAAFVMDKFAKPFFDSGKAGFLLACFQSRPTR